MPSELANEMIGMCTDLDLLGSVDGNRIWGKELKNTNLTGVQWSPDNRLLLFSLANGECHLYDNQGNFAVNSLLTLILKIVLRKLRYCYLFFPP